MPEPLRDIHEKIATAKIKNHGLTDIYYVGGSTFELDIDNGSGKKPTVKKSVIDKLVASKQLRLINPNRYREITASIDPKTGATKTHNADGTKKSKLAQMTSELEDEGYIAETPNGIVHTAHRNQPARNESQERPQQHQIADPFADDDDDMPKSMNTGDDGFSRNGRMNGESSYVTDDVDPFGDDMPATSDDMASMSDDGSDDGYGNEGGKPEERRIARGPRTIPIIVFVVLSVILCIVLFFGAAAITATFSKGSWISLKLPTLPQAQQQQTQDTEKDSDGEQSGTNANSEDQQPEGTVDRGDFDPEDGVIDYPLASDEQYDLANGFFTSLRQTISNGDVKSFNSMVAVDSIASQIASAYASYAQLYQNITESETDELSDYYAETFAEAERQHVVDKDSYASIFGGRIREVRVDQSDSMRLYVVMESLGGDHQRACYVLQGDKSSGAYALTEMVDVNGYVQMIMQGSTDANQKEYEKGGGEVTIDDNEKTDNDEDKSEDKTSSDDSSGSGSDDNEKDDKEKSESDADKADDKSSNESSGDAVSFGDI